MRWLSHPLVIAAITFAGLIFSYSLTANLHKTRTSTEHLGVLEQEITEKASQVSELEQQAERAKSAEAQEKIIRDELLMQKPGETLVQLPEINRSDLPLPSPSPSPTPWEEWRELLF
jgi:cell division protein FtsB